MPGATKAELVKFIASEIKETELALGFVMDEIKKKTTTQFNHVYRRKQAEYEGVLWALNAVLDVAEGREDEGAKTEAGGTEDRAEGAEVAS